jgi:predicted SAM-dependent methyltransferase
MSLASRLKSGWHRVDQPRNDLPLLEDLPAEQFVDLAYQVVLGRKADPYGLRHHSEQLSTGKKTRNHFVYELTQSPDFKANKPDVNELTEEDFVSLTYQVILGRRGSAQEISFNAEKLRADGITRHHLIHTMFCSHEFKTNTWSGFDFWLHHHRARLILAAQLPKAERIVDLGGSSEGNPCGAMIMYGYPYSFKSLSIVELPREARHELYTEICGEYDQVIETPQGPVNYVYTSMSDLSAFGDGTIDLVYAGQSIEHVTVEEAKTVLREVNRVLKPGGHFCFDTPNRKVTILQFPNYVVDDHKYEYTHPEMVELLEGHGFAVREAKGLVLMDQSVRENRFIEKEVMGRDRLYDDIENCFLLYYKAQKV